MPDPRIEPVCCADPRCGRELTSHERRARADQDGLCDGCFLETHAAPTAMLSPEANAQTIAERRAIRDAAQRIARIALRRAS